MLFNDALNTFYLQVIWCWKEVFYLTTHSTHFYLRLYGVGHMVKGHADSERRDSLPPHGLLFTFSSKVVFYMHHPRQDSTYHGPCYTSRGVLAGMSTNRKNE